MRKITKKIQCIWIKGWKKYTEQLVKCKIERKKVKEYTGSEKKTIIRRGYNRWRYDRKAKLIPTIIMNILLRGQSKIGSEMDGNMVNQLAEYQWLLID